VGECGRQGTRGLGSGAVLRTVGFVEPKMPSGHIALAEVANGGNSLGG
jgi:hypothetical protein